MMLALTNRLRVSGPLPSEKEIAGTRRALQQGVDILAREGLKAPTLQVVIWRLAQDAAETERSLNDRERGWLTSCGRSIWPEVERPSEDCRKIEWEISMAEIAGVRTPDETPIRHTISDPTAVERMLTVLAWLRFVKGKTRWIIRRDQRVFIALAAGRRPCDVRYEYLPRRSSDSTLRAIKGKVLLHVALGLKPYTKQLTINGRSRNLR